jgi:hypothetical protein
VDFEEGIKTTIEYFKESLKARSPSPKATA